MSETCIVCLGDLGEGATDPATSNLVVRAVKSPDDDHARLVHTEPPTSTTANDVDVGAIAHLLPCGHVLHNECLKPWVERANSCPICRQNFNQVELCAFVGGKSPLARATSSSHSDRFISGPVISSYAVADRTQIADVDPSMLIEELDEEEAEDAPCRVCQDDDNEEILLACDGCDAYYHTYCVGLESVPAGHWFCENCQTNRAIESVCPPDWSQSIPARAHHPPDRRTRGQVRRIRNRNQATSSNWARVWQSVWDNLNLDLDFPFDDGSDGAHVNRSTRATSQRREFREWERRLQVAERQGGANRFRDTASTLLDLHARREQPEEQDPESQEELRAWNAFEKAKEIDADPNPKRKRRSATTSPSDAEPVPEPERPLKRPRTRRNLDHIDTTSNDSRRTSAAGPSSSRQTSLQNGNGPSFLQSMLREIETSSAPDDSTNQMRIPQHIATNHSSPQPSSPGASPTASNHPTPRAGSTTPTPVNGTRPGSPLSLTSKVEPIYPPAEYSPNRSPPETSASPIHPRFHHKRQSRPLNQGSSPPARSPDTSPTRANMPFSTKADLQKMVSTALKPHYQSNTVSKDQYTDINRHVSRMLYDLVGDSANLDDGEAREGWERKAVDEVAKAVRSLTTDAT